LFKLQMHRTKLEPNRHSVYQSNQVARRKDTHTQTRTHRHSYCHKGGVEEREMEVEVVLLGRVRATERKQKHECKEEAESAR